MNQTTPSAGRNKNQMTSANGEDVHKATSEFDNTIKRRNTWKLVNKEEKIEDEATKQTNHESDDINDAAKLFIEKQTLKEKLYKQKMEWRLLAKIADRLCLIFFLTSVIVVTVTMFAVAGA